jgi:archaellum component FlaC
MTDKDFDESTDPRYRVFQSLFYVDSKPGLEQKLRDELKRWLGEPGRDFSNISLEESGFYAKPGVDLRFVHSVSSEGIAYQAKLSETKESGTWRSTFTFSLPKSKNERGWMLIRIANDEGLRAKPPRLLKYLVESGLVVDGGSQMPLEAQVYRETMLADLFNEIATQDRRTPIFVTATDSSRDFDQYVAKAKIWAKKLPGLARFVILDPPASATFRRGLGDEFAVPTWTVRSYLPGVAQDVTFDARRHKILGVKRLQEPPARVQGTLETIARGLTYQEVFPDYVNSTLRRLQRLEDKAMIEAIVAEPEMVESKPAGLTVAKTDRNTPVSNAPRISEEVEEYLAKISLVESILGIEEITVESLEHLSRIAKTGYVAQAALESLTREFNLRQDQVESLETYNSELVIGLNEMETEVGMLEEDRRELAERVRNLEKQNQWLLKQIDESDRYQSEFLDLINPEKVQQPKDWEEFVLKIGDVQDWGIFFSGDAKKALELEQYDDVGNFVRSAWDSVLVLRDYIEARRDGTWSQSVHEFIEHEGSFPPRKHAKNESGVTRRNNKKNNERDFPVPTKVSSSGFATMYAHFKLGKKGRVDPRMYYLDNFTEVGFVYIGYVGVHLKNTLT